MTLQTVGHAGMLLRDETGAPLLFTDPWVIGSCYWRSWWLQNYPDDRVLDEIRQVRYCVITHEHPDHFHTASIRALGAATHYLSPAFPHGHVVSHLRQQGRPASTLPPFTWVSIHPQVQVLSIPLLNDDSMLIVNTPTAVLINANDSKPRPSQLRQLAATLDERFPGKTRVLLSSYSPASIVNSFIRGSARVSLREKASYVRAIVENCRLLKADVFMPFASQVIYKRRDSAWANEFKVSFEDLQREWAGTPTRLLAPFSTIDLETGESRAVPPEQYRHEDTAITPKVDAQEALDAAAEFTDTDVERLRAKLAHCRWLLAGLFPRGIGFELEHAQLHYDPWRGRLTRGASAGDFVMRVPGQAFKEAIEYGHFGDLGTTMFTIIKLNSAIHPRRVYLFFMLLTLHDYGHTTSVSNGVSWLRRSLQIHRWHIPGDPSAAQPVNG